MCTCLNSRIPKPAMWTAPTVIVTRVVSDRSCSASSGVARKRALRDREQTNSTKNGPKDLKRPHVSVRTVARSSENGRKMFYDENIPESNSNGKRRLEIGLSTPVDWKIILKRNPIFAHTIFRPHLRPARTTPRELGMCAIRRHQPGW